MPRAGEVRVRLNRRWCAAITACMEVEKVRPSIATALGSPNNQQTRLMNIDRLSMLMGKASVRHRSGAAFVVLIDRQLASFFAGLYLPFCSDYRALWRAQREFQRVLSAKPGRQRLVGKRLKGRLASMHMDRRHRFRLKARGRSDAAFERWAAYLEASGETALTATKPLADFLT